MIEFLIRRTDGEWFDLPASRLLEVLRPSSFSSEVCQEEDGIMVQGCLITFSYEDAGIQVSFEGGSLSEGETSQIIGEIAERLTEVTGQKGWVVPL